MVDDNIDGEEDDDDDEEDEDEEGEIEYDDDVSVSGVPGRKREYTAEEKEAESAAIGYKVIGPLDKNDQPFKPYEPVFAVVQVSFANLFCLVLIE